MKGSPLAHLSLGLLLAVPAAAQYGSSAPQQMPQSSAQPPPGQTPAAVPPATGDSRGHVMQAATCVATNPRHAEAVGRLLATPPYSQEEMQQAQRVMRLAQRCLDLDRPLATSAILFRISIAEALYKAQFAQPQAPRTPALTVAPLLQPAAATNADLVSRLTLYHSVSECAVAQQRDPVLALLATEPGGDAEVPAIQALTPAFRACVPAGTRLAFDRAVIRGILAEALYRWSVVQRDGSASPWAAAAATAAATN